MFVSIRARNVFGSQKGKETWVNSPVRSLDVKFDRPTHLGHPDWYLLLTGKTIHEVASGLRGGDMREINRDLEIHLTPDDLQRLIEFAVSKGLVTLRAHVVADKPVDA